MADSKKELILKAIEQILLTVIAGNTPDGLPEHVFSNTIGYINRQYIDISLDDIENKEMPWVILNNEGEGFRANPSRNFENKIYVQIVGFVKATEAEENLDTLMNSLQKDIMLAILNDVSLLGTADYIMPIDIQTVDEMIHPYGGFAMNFEVVYVFNGLNF